MNYSVYLHNQQRRWQRCGPCCMNRATFPLVAHGNADRSAIPETLPAQIGCLGRYLVELIQSWADIGRAVAIDSTILRGRGGVWHQKHREQGEIPHTSIDPEARLPQIRLAVLSSMDGSCMWSRLWRLSGFPLLRY